jgi:hypothetical protein
MKHKHKQALRCFILEKLSEVTNLELADLAEQSDSTPFEMAEQFDIEFERISKLFNYPSYSDELEAQ